MNYIIWKITENGFTEEARVRNEEVAKIFTNLSNGWNEEGVKYEYTKIGETPIW